MFFYYGKDVLLEDGKIYRFDAQVYHRPVRRGGTGYTCLGTFIGKMPLFSVSFRDAYEHVGKWGPLVPEHYAKKLSKIPLQDYIVDPERYYYNVLYQMPLLHWSSSYGTAEFIGALEKGNKVPWRLPNDLGSFLLCGWGADARVIDYQAQYRQKLIQKIYTRPGPKPTPLFLGEDPEKPTVYVGMPSHELPGRCIANAKNSLLNHAVLGCLSLRKSLAPHKHRHFSSLFEAAPGWEQFLDDLLVGGTAHEDTTFRTTEE